MKFYIRLVGKISKEKIKAKILSEAIVPLKYPQQRAVLLRQDYLSPQRSLQEPEFLLCLMWAQFPTSPLSLTWLLVCSPCRCSPLCPTSSCYHPQQLLTCLPQPRLPQKGRDLSWHIWGPMPGLLWPLGAAFCLQILRGPLIVLQVYGLIFVCATVVPLCAEDLQITIKRAGLPSKFHGPNA